MIPQQQPQQQPEQYEQPGEYQQQMPMYTPENTIDNLVEQINPAQIIDNLDHALKGEIYNKEKGIWEMNSSKKPLVNDACRGSIISYISGILTNNTTMGIIDNNQLSNVMEEIIDSTTKSFVCNLEEFGFVAAGDGFNKGEYENKGSPDTARMTRVSGMIYIVCFMVLSRALNGMESKKIFNSLSMTDSMGYNPMPQQGNWISKMMGR